jgi:hypothetical protein
MYTCRWKLYSDIKYKRLQSFQQAFEKLLLTGKYKMEYISYSHLQDHVVNNL